MLTLRLDRTSRVFAAVAMLALAATPAVAELAAVGLDANGNPNPQTTFPFWYMDTNGLALELNLHPTLGISAPPIDDPNDPNFAFSQQIGMGDEGFFFSADATVATVQRDKNGNLVAGNAILVQAIEAAFATGPPVDGDQMVFARIRIRVDVPAAGTYTITYPYGRKTYTVALDPVTGGGRAINDTIDIGLGVKAWAECLKGEIGPFLTWDADLPVLDATGAAYIGDPGIPHRVVGSPTGFNKFRVDGPPGCGIGGPGVDFVETDLFVVTGKLFTGQVPTPLVTKRATYRRTAAGEVSVFAQSTPTATASVAGGPNLPGGPIPMINDGTGRLFAHIPLADATTLPSFVSITAQSGTNTPTALNQALTDEVTILNAAYSPAAEQLVIEAVSSDHWGAGPTLTAVGLGARAARDRGEPGRGRHRERPGRGSGLRLSSAVPGRGYPQLPRHQHRRPATLRRRGRRPGRLLRPRPACRPYPSRRVRRPRGAARRRHARRQGRPGELRDERP